MKTKDYIYELINYLYKDKINHNLNKYFLNYFVKFYFF
jgi:hypothetical protein